MAMAGTTRACSTVVTAIGSASAPSLDGFQDIEFRSDGDGSPQRYVMWLPAGFDKTEEYHLMIVLHGHGSDRWQYIRDERAECAVPRELAMRNNMVLVSPDYRAPDSWMGPQAEADLVQIIRDLRNSFRVGKIILGGASMGGTAALTFAVLHPGVVDGVVSQNSMANLVEYDGFQDSRDRSYGGRKDTVPDEYRRRSAEFFPERLTMPVAFTLSSADTIVPPQSALRLTRSLQKMNRNVLLVHRESGGHFSDAKDTLAAYQFIVERVLARPA